MDYEVPSLLLSQLFDVNPGVRTFALRPGRPGRRHDDGTVNMYIRGSRMHWQRGLG